MTIRMRNWLMVGAALSGGCSEGASIGDEYDVIPEGIAESSTVDTNGCLDDILSCITGKSTSNPSRPPTKPISTNANRWNFFHQHITPLGLKFREAGDKLIREVGKLQYSGSNTEQRRKMMCLDAARSLRDLTTSFQTLLLSAEEDIQSTAGQERGDDFHVFRSEVDVVVTHCKTLEEVLLDRCKITAATSPSTGRRSIGASRRGSMVAEISIVQLLNHAPGSHLLETGQGAQQVISMTPVTATRSIDGNPVRTVGLEAKRVVRLDLDDGRDVPQSAPVKTRQLSVFMTPSVTSRKIGSNDDPLEQTAYSSYLTDQVNQLFSPNWSAPNPNTVQFDD